MITSAIQAEHPVKTVQLSMNGKSMILAGLMIDWHIVETDKVIDMTPTRNDTNHFVDNRQAVYAYA